MSDKQDKKQDTFSGEIQNSLDELKILYTVVARELDKNPLLKNNAVTRLHLAGSMATCFAVHCVTKLLPKNKDPRIVIGFIETMAPAIMQMYIMGLIDAMEPSGDKILEEKSSAVIQEGSS